MNTDLQYAGAKRFYDLQLPLERESLSGPGSFLKSTKNVRAWLPKIIKQLNIKSIADIPCGDFYWMSLVQLGCDYTGYDLLPELIERNRKNHPLLKFEQLNAIIQQPPKVDCIICRDLIVHLTFEHALQMLRNFRLSGTKYLITNTYRKYPNHNLGESHPGWGWRPLDLELPPFNLANKIDGVQEPYADSALLLDRWINIYELNP